MTGLVLRRVRAHRLLLAAALLAVLLTTSVLAALTAFAGSIGDAALRHTLGGRAAPAASLVVTAQIPPAGRDAAERAVRKGARETFGGLPVTVRSLARSGSYAMPRALQPPAARSGEPDLTHFAALDRSRVRLVRGSWPEAAATGPVRAALPEEAARRLKLAPGARLTLTDRLGGTPLTALITGVYRPAAPADPYWRLDEAGGRGVRTVVFTTYGPLLTDPAVLASGRLTTDETSWLATADFGAVTTEDMAGLRAAATAGPVALAADPALGGAASARTSLPAVLDETERALLVARSTLLIVAVQLVLLAAYALLLVARLLGTERAGETALLRARGGSRRRIAGLAAVEALLLAAPAAVVAPLLAGPLTRLLAGTGSLHRIGVRLGGEAPGGEVWLVAAGVALCCAAAVVAPAATAGPVRLWRGRAAALPGPVRAGADIGLVVVAAVAYWRLDRQTDSGAGGGALSGGRDGGLGVDPALVVAPALALLAGTVLTLRLLPPAARLAERRAAAGRGLSAALAGWQFSRRPLRGAGPVLLLVPAVAMGMLAIGQSASWDRSQRDQADFATGAPVRVLDDRSGDPGQAGRYARLLGVRDAAPAHRAETELPGDRTATVLALDTTRARERLLLRDDLAGGRPDRLPAGLAPRPQGAARPGMPLPDGTVRLRLRLRLEVRARGTATDRAVTVEDRYDVAVAVEDRYGLVYRLPVENGAADLGSASGGPAGPVTVTGVEVAGPLPYQRSERHRFTVERLVAVGPDGGERPVPATAARWQGRLTTSEQGREPEPVTVVPSSGTPLTLSYDTGATLLHPRSDPQHFTVRATAPAPAVTASPAVTAAAPEGVPGEVPEGVPAIATDAFVAAAGAAKGESLEVTVAGERLRVRIADTVREVPTTSADGGALLVDLGAVNRTGAALAPTEWWLSTEPGRADDVAAALRARPGMDPAQVLVRDETAGELLGDPLGAGPRSALMAASVAAAALAAVGFAVSATGSLRERSAEFAVLRALGASRRRLARLVAVEQGLLVGVALLVGLALGAVLTRAVVPLVVLTGRATRPVPHVLVELPPAEVVALLAGVAALPLLTVAAIALRRHEPAAVLRHQGHARGGD
ncbi:ABC transporter permease [Streptomyces sp. NPDC006368]|uniref:ABC transporter permease n=1 Tax=Streptomyces sp. NPDC006368 TaxID=3156760 RepID=UPI0033BD92DD